MASSTKIIKGTSTTPNDSGTFTSQVWNETATAGANIFAIQDTAKSVKLKLTGTSGDVVYIEGLSNEYAAKLVGTALTLVSDTQRIVISMAKGSTATLAFLDGTADVNLAARTLGTQKLTVTGKLISTAVNDTTPAATAALNYFTDAANSTTNAPVYTLTSSPVTAAEGSTLTFQLSLDTAPTSPVTVNYNTVAGTASTADFTSDAGTVTFAAGQKVGFVTIQTLTDNLVEGTENLTLNVSGANVKSATTAVGADIAVAGSITDTTVANGTSGTTLTIGNDNIVATTASTFVAPIQNNTNTLQTGDTLTGSGTDKLVATIANSQNFAIAANTKGIATVQIQAQANSSDSTNNNTSQTNQVQIDAQNMNGVTRYEDNNSRSDLLIEDVRIKSSNINAASNADRQEVILNADRTVNAVATKAAGTTSWEVTKDITLAMVSTDPGHVDYGVYFDPNSLRAGESSTTNSLTIQLLDIKGAQQAVPSPLKANVYTGINISVDGTLVNIQLQSATGGPITSSYADIATAVNAGLKAKGLDGKVSAAVTDAFTRIDADSGKSIAGGFNITLSAKNAVLDSVAATWETLGNQPQPANSNLYANVNNTTPNIISPLVTSNIIIDDVGRGSTGGNLVVGSLSIGDTSLSLGVDQFNIHVDRNSKLEAINSTNNALREVYIDNANNVTNATGIHNGNLTVMGQVVTGNNPSTNMAINAPIANAPGVAQAIPGMITANGGSQFNQYGFNDVRVIDASAMTGAITFNAAVTQASIAKYINLVDTAPAVANTDNANFIYKGTAQNDNITVALDPQAVAFAFQTNKLSGREDLTLSVDGGAGNDNITVGIYTAKDADGNYNATNNINGNAATTNVDAWYNNQKLNANITVSGGAGDDMIMTPGAGDKNIAAGSGADTVYSDNTGRQVVSNPLNSMVTLAQAASKATYAGESLATATWVENALNSLPAALNLNNLESDTNPTYALFLGKLAVKFDGYSSAAIVIPTTTSTSYVTSQLQINQAIKTAINSDPVLNKLLIAQDGPANTLVITSKIDGVYNMGDIQFSITQPTALEITNSGVSLQSIYNTQNGIVNSTAPLTTSITAATIAAQQGTSIAQANGNAVPAALGFIGAATTVVWSPDMANDGINNIVGKNSVTTSDNLINAGTSEASTDVVVLGTTFGPSTLSSSNEVVSLAQNFGKQVVVHFDANAGDAGQDVINFSNLFTTPAKFGAAVPTVNQTFDVKVVAFTTAANNTTAAVGALFKTGSTIPGYIDPTTTLANGFKYDHVVLVEGSTPGFTSVYSVENGTATYHGLLSVLGLGGQATGGNVLGMNALLTSNSFNSAAVINNTTTAAVTTNGGYGFVAALPTATLTSSVGTITETAGGNVVTYTATLNTPAATALSIPYTLTGTGITTFDFGGAALTGNINIAAGALTGTLVLTAATDLLTETGGETVSVALNTIAGATVNTTPVTTTITDTSTGGGFTPSSLDGLGTLTTAAAPLNLANTGTFNYTDNVATANNVSIANFGLDDQLTITGSSAAIYNDVISTNGVDVTISFNNIATNAVNTIVLVGVNPAGAFVNSVATFNALLVGDLLFA